MADRVAILREGRLAVVDSLENLRAIAVRRPINSVASRRGAVSELLVVSK